MECIPLTPDGFVIKDNGRELLRHTVQQPAVRIGFGSPEVKSHSGAFKIKEKKIRWLPLGTPSGEEKPDEISLSFLGGKFTLRIEKKGAIYSIFPACTDPAINRFALFFTADPHERIYGGGELFDRLKLNGTKLPLWISEPGVGRRFDLFTLSVALKTGHIPRWYHRNFVSASWCTDSGRYVWARSSACGILDFTDKNRQGCMLWEVPGEISLGFADNLKTAVSGLSDLLGRQPLLPDWVWNGMWLGIQGGSAAVETKVQAALDADCKVGGVWCQDWEGIRMTSFGKQLRWAWEYDDKLYPKLPDLIAKLKKQGIAYLAYANTFLTPGSALFDEADAKGYLIQTKEGENYPVYVPFDPGYLVDFTQPEACSWLKDILKKNMIDLGIAGWMADFGEYIPHDCVLHSAEDPLTYHNRYPAEWARINDSAVKESPSDPIFFMRAASPFGIRHMSSFWTGDQLVDWSREDGLPSALIACLSVGFTGVGYCHSDLGGYTTLLNKKRSQELLLRWAEFSAFTPTMRSHEGNRPLSNHQFDSDPETLLRLGKMTRVFAALKPYHEQLSHEYQKSGIPPMRPCFMEYPEEKEILEPFSYQYCYGTDLLVAPVVKKGAVRKKVRLPRGEWMHLWTDELWKGGQTYTLPAPLGQPPVFYRKCSPQTELFREVSRC